MPWGTMSSNTILLAFHFASYTTAQLSAVKTSAAIRKETVSLVSPVRWLRSTTTLVWSSELTEHMLPCKHAICDTCVVISESQVVSESTIFEISQCPICEEKSDCTRQLLQRSPCDSHFRWWWSAPGSQLRLLRAFRKSHWHSDRISLDLCVGTSVGTYAEWPSLLLWLM